MRTHHILILFTIMLLGQSQTASALQIVATLPALGQIAEGVAGSHAEVRILAHVGQDPHFVPPKPTLARHLANADLLVSAGLGLEIGWLPPLLEAARNGHIRQGSSGYIDGTMVIPRVLGIPRGKISRALGDIHPEGNPHWWLNPDNGVRLAKVLAQKLAALDPAHAEIYRHNSDQLAAEVVRRQEEWSKSLHAYAPLVSYHDSYRYLAEKFDLPVVDFVEPKPGIEPSTAHLDNLVQQLQAGAASAVWLEPYHDGKTVRKLCELGHTPCRIMPDAVQGSGFAAYLQLFDLIATGGE